MMDLQDNNILGKALRIFSLKHNIEKKKNKFSACGNRFVKRLVPQVNDILFFQTLPLLIWH